MQNGAQNGLMFHAKASNSSPLVSTPVNISLNINPALLVSSPPANTNPPYISGLIAMGSDRISRLSSSGALYMSGLLFGGLTRNSLFTLNYSIVPNGTLYKFIATLKNSDYFCGMTNTNRVYCWGDNEFGQLGFGITSPSSSIIPPTAVDMLPLAGKTPNSIQSGYKNTCISTTDNSTFCWGRKETNSFGISGKFKTMIEQIKFYFS